MNKISYYLKSPWLYYLIVVILSVLSVVYMQQRYTTMLQGGAEYQWPVKVEYATNWVPDDSLTIKFLGNKTSWIGEKQPSIGKPIYVALGVQPNGVLYVKNASDRKPLEGEYILATAEEYTDGLIEFSIPYNKVRVNLEKVNPIFYNGQYKGLLMATLKLRNGEAVVTGVYNQGISLELAEPSSDAELMNKKDALLLPSAIINEENKKTQTSY